MDLNEIVVFARVVAAKSFSAAARALDMPKSTVSRKVAQLEDRVGTRLLQRTTRKLGLTDAGRVYYEHAVRVVAEVEEADQAMSRMHAAPCGRLRVTAPLSFDLLAPAVSEYLARNPAVTVDLVCTDRTVNLIEEGFDVAVRAGPLVDSTLMALKLGVLERVLVAAPKYLARHGAPRAPADLAAHACISFGAGATPNLWTLYSGDERVEVSVAPRLIVNDLDLVAEAARAGLGIAWVARHACAADLRARRLRQVLPAWRSGEVPVHALYPTARHLSPKVAAFIALARKRFPSAARRR